MVTVLLNISSRHLRPERVLEEEEEEGGEGVTGWNCSTVDVKTEEEREMIRQVTTRL